jgi:hypothetical protein
MPGTKIKGAFLTLFNGSIISDSLEVLSDVFEINRIRHLGFEHLLPKRIYQYFSEFRHLSTLIISTFLRYSILCNQVYSPTSALKSPEVKAPGILGTQYLICSRPDWYGVPGIANSEDPVLTSWYIWGLDNCSIYVVVLGLSRVAKQGPSI